MLVNCRSNSTIKYFQRNFTSNRDIFAGLSDYSDEFYYIDCPIEYTDNNFTCKVTVETPKKEPFDFTQTTCNASFPNWNVYRRRPFLKPLNETYILLINVHNFKNYDNETGCYEDMYIGYQYYTIKETTIYFIRTADCHVVEHSLSDVELKLPSEFTEQIISTENQDYFDVFYEYEYNFLTSSNDCKSNICKVRYSLDGKVIDGPREYLKKLDVNVTDSWMFPFWFTLTSNYTYYYFYESPGAVRIYQVYNDVAKAVFRTISYLYSLKIADVSTSNNKVCFCLISTRYENYVGFQQYDLEGNLLITFNLDDELDYFSDNISLYNLKDGGFIVASSGSGVFEYHEQGILKIYRVYSNEKYSLIEIPRTGTIRQLKFLEYDTELCLKFISYGRESNMTFYTIRCIPKSKYE